MSALYGYARVSSTDQDPTFGLLAVGFLILLLIVGATIWHPRSNSLPALQELKGR